MGRVGVVDGMARRRWMAEMAAHPEVADAREESGAVFVAITM